MPARELGLPARVLPIEVGPVAPFRGHLVGTSGEKFAVVLDVFTEDDLLGAAKSVEGDGHHLVHVFRSCVDERIVRIEIRADDWIVPVLGQQRHDRVGAFGGPAIDQFAIIVVAQRDVLGLAEGLQ